MIKNKLWQWWLKILTLTQERVNLRIQASGEIHVVYCSHLNPDIYVCKNGEAAIELRNQLVKLNMLINRPQITILYGKADLVFKYKMVKLMDLVITWDASQEETRKIYQFITDVPLNV